MKKMCMIETQCFYLSKQKIRLSTQSFDSSLCKTRAAALAALQQ